MLSGDAARPGKNAARVLLGSVCRKPVKEVWLHVSQLLTFFPDIRIFSKNSYIWVYEMD